MPPQPRKGANKKKGSKKNGDEEGKKGKSVKAGGIVPTGKIEDEDNGDSTLDDCDEERMKPKPSKKAKMDTEEGQEEGEKKSLHRKVDALTAAVGRAVDAAKAAEAKVKKKKDPPPPLPRF